MFLQSVIDNKKQLAVLIDPDKQSLEKLQETVIFYDKAGADFFLIGGSLLFADIEPTVETVKKNTKKPVLLFPGSLMQLSNNADGILLLSLISGRNPDMLIGNHITAAPFLKKSKLEIIPAGYILIEGGVQTSVEYMSGTRAIPADKTDIAVATAIAGELTGKKIIYLEAGSGAINHVPFKTINAVKENIDIPLIVGGGIKDAETASKIYKSGADIIVIGTAAEKNPNIISEIVKVKNYY